MRRCRANLPSRCHRQIDRVAHRAFEGWQAVNRECRAAMTRKTYCGNLLWQSSLTLLACCWLEKLGVSTQGSGVRSWREELFSFPVPHSCSLRSRRVRVPRNIPRAKRAAPAVARGVRHSCRGHQTQTEGRGGTETTCEGRLGERVSCEWGEWKSWQAAFKQRRLRAVLRGQAARLMRRVSWSRVAQIGFASTYGTVYV